MLLSTTFNLYSDAKGGDPDKTPHSRGLLFSYHRAVATGKKNVSTPRF
ncbi:hypothetical protein TRIP_D370004 [uncultured Paludibacter sp.]|uniref:Uncharacterized protein n=1 Tax=uncultured Paludibacter sp. TaxID=497635 RepID=A0A653AEA8_9BACT|nr:hypothetical protein TRIP_D370004 [uncultured Paludibacter sp.]